MTQWVLAQRKTLPIKGHEVPALVLVTWWGQSVGSAYVVPEDEADAFMDQMAHSPNVASVERGDSCTLEKAQTTHEGGWFYA